MAELINEIISPEAFKQVADMKSELTSLTKQMENMIKVLNTSSTNSGGGVKGVSDSIKKDAEDTKELIRLKNQIATLTQRLTALQTEHGEAYAKAKVKLQEYNKNLLDQERASKMAEGSIDQMRVKLNQMEKAYTAMSASMRNNKVGQTLFAEMTKAREAVTLLEQSMGNYKRNVGNYTNATFQLTQVLREMPAFAYSAQTGIMAISNNLPMLADGFKRVREETGSTSAALKIFGASIFTFTNLFSIAIGAFALFAPKIIEFIKGVDDSTKALQLQKKAFEDSINAGNKEITTLEGLYRMTTDVSVAYKTRVKAAEELQKMYPEYFGNLKTEAILAGDAKKAYEGLNNELVKNTIYKAFSAQAEEMAKSLPALYKQLDDLNKQLADESKKGLNAISTYSSGVPMEVSVAANSALILAKKNVESQISTIKNGMIQVFKIANQYATGLNIGDDTNNETGRGKRNSKSNSKARIEQVKQEKFDEFKMTLQLLEEYNQRELFEIEKQLANKQITNEAYESLVLKRQIQYFNEQIIAYKDYAQATEKLEVNRLKKINDYNEKASKDNLDMIKSNLDSMQNMWDNADKERLDQIHLIEENINAIQEGILGFGNVYSTLIDRQISEIDQKQKRMEEYYDAEYTALEQLTLSDEERAKRRSALDAQKRAQEKRFEAERNQAIKKQAQIQKATDIMSIITSTAVAVIKAYTEGDPYTKIPRSIAAGIAGATQLAAAIAAPLPQFAEGTESSPEGFAIVGERGTELVQSPDGKSWLTPAKDTLTYLKKGSKVIPNHELMQMVKNSTMLNLASSGGVVTPDIYGAELVRQFEGLSEKVDALSRVMANKDMSVQIRGDFDHYMHVKRNIR